VFLAFLPAFPQRYNGNKRRKAMTVITTDAALQAVLAGLKDRAEIRDAAGNVLGYFTPRQVEEERLYRRAEELFKPGEVQRDLAEQRQGCSLDELMSRLRSQETG
jgi:hypothetical protein